MSINRAENLRDPFRLKASKVAKVSEISEATAAAAVSEKDRINFHIGNPLQDQRLSDLYLQLIGGTGPAEESGDHPEQTGASSGPAPDYAAFLENALLKSAPYLPRGGFSSKNPPEIIRQILDWLSRQQIDPIAYDTGERSGEKEIMLASGGVTECLRLLFFGLSRDLETDDAAVLLYHFPLPTHLRNFPRLHLNELPADENAAYEVLEKRLTDHPGSAVFILLGVISTENFRRRLRRLSLHKALFIIEANDAPNHLSLAREANMASRALRFLKPAALSAQFSESALVVALGHSPLIRLLETIHFELKGTPSAPDVEFLTWLLKNPRVSGKGSEPFHPKTEVSQEPYDFLPEALTAFMDKTSHRITALLDLSALRTDRAAQFVAHVQRRVLSQRRLPGQQNDAFSALSSAELARHFSEHTADPEWLQELQENFLNVFVNHHPEYDRSQCLAVSGSARTALGLLGFHCSLNNIITCDLGWTYEHCFPQVDTVPLRGDLSLDISALVAKVAQEMERDPNWPDRSAVVINNPHNATGQVFPENDLRELLREILSRNIFVIDDLSYQNVRPVSGWLEIPTLRQITNDLHRAGYITQEQSARLLTVHSLSKTDCFAGARMAVTEIRHPALFEKFRSVLECIKPNYPAILLAYLFYRNPPDAVRGYWMLRNQIFRERMDAMLQAYAQFPAERNPWQIEIKPPAGSMYPHLIVHKLPPGVSLDWLAAGLAGRGIGLIPLTTFARSGAGYDLARKSFRLTLGGRGDAESFHRHTRRVLIDLNRLIDQEAARYIPHRLPLTTSHRSTFPDKNPARRNWETFIAQVQKEAGQRIKSHVALIPADDRNRQARRFIDEFLPQRLTVIQQQFEDRLEILSGLQGMDSAPRRQRLSGMLEKELYRQELDDRRRKFAQRLFDRTVHPTQMYALDVDVRLNGLIGKTLADEPVAARDRDAFSEALVYEFLGENVAITSMAEAEELICDLDAHIGAEEVMRWKHDLQRPAFLSFWGDWDGSTRPSGQGHRLVTAVVIENVRRLAGIITTLRELDSGLPIDAGLLAEISRLPHRRRSFWKLLNEITTITNQLEKRYQSILPFEMPGGRLRNAAARLHLLADPVKALWQHNDRLEKHMLNLRRQRRQGMEYYFALNKRLRKTLYDLLPEILKRLDNPALLRSAGLYRDLLQRFALTPRIHQKIILADDPFAIDTTVHNLMEINAISARYGNPGLALALQVSMSTEARALIALERKLAARRENILRGDPGLALPSLWIIPLFEDKAAVGNLETYLDKVWEYAVSSRRMDQAAEQRFAEMICELFVAGSDLSQQIGQPAAERLYGQAKFTAMRWLADKGLINRVRIKLGSGEAAQRQGGYYSSLGGQPAFPDHISHTEILARQVSPAGLKSAEFARSPLDGVMSSGDLRTFQSALAECIRQLPAAQRAELLYHIGESQAFHDEQLRRAGETFIETRLQFREQSLQELQRLTSGSDDAAYDKFLEIAARNFRHILYGSEEDIVGLHVVSYFISRCEPSLRDRPTIRPGRDSNKNSGPQVVERLAQTLPLAHHGSLLRAIGHNRAQTMILGVCQLTTGLFRAFNETIAGMSLPDGQALIRERLTPHLPVYDILQNLRLYHDSSMRWLKQLEALFPPGNSAMLVLHEDLAAMPQFISLFQMEVLRRNGLNVSDFFSNGHFNGALLPALRPDLAVILQRDIFNTDLDELLKPVAGRIAPAWRNEVQRLLDMPRQVTFWRERIRVLIGEMIIGQVQSFNELSLAIYKLMQGSGQQALPLAVSPGRLNRLGLDIKKALRSQADDSMRQFLLAAVQYLTELPKSMPAIPVEVIRALRDAERIVRIEQQALSLPDQEVLRFYILQIARLCGENG
jgi:aspartate/methionine/tyrosine aminotransferase